jgi:trans-2-enoyl-CoA reductase
VVPASKLRTLQRGTEPASVLPGANAHEPYLEELAQMSVNVQTAWRMLTDFATLTPTQATVVLNAPTSAVGRAVIQLCKHRGVDVVALLRPRPTHEAFAADANRLIELGASHVFADDGAVHRSVEARAQLANLPPVRLALNGVGGASCVNVSSMLAKDGVVVTYGGMSKQPVGVPTGSAIFKNVSARGFWLTRWLEDRRMEEETAVNTDPMVVPWAHGAFMAPPDSAYARGERAAMGNECERLIRAGALNLPTRRVGLEEACEVIGTGVSVGAGKTMIWMKE